MAKLKLNWYNGNLINLKKYNLEYNGVYIIFLYPDSPIFRVGSGNIKDRLSKHANPNEDFMIKFKKYNEDKNANYNYKSLSVVFAKVNGNQMRGVEKYLGNKLKIVKETSERFPNKEEEIEVDIP